MGTAPAPRPGRVGRVSLWSPVSNAPRRPRPLPEPDAGLRPPAHRAPRGRAVGPGVSASSRRAAAMARGTGARRTTKPIARSAVEGRGLQGRAAIVTSKTPCGTSAPAEPQPPLAGPGAAAETGGLPSGPDPPAPAPGPGDANASPVMPERSGAAAGQAAARAQRTAASPPRPDPLLPPVRMQAVGQLAAGLAHDLNTLLGGIVATAELLREEAPVGSRQEADLAAIVEQAGRAAALIRQLLAFSRQEMLRPRPVRLGELVLRLRPVIRAQIGRHIRLVLPPDPGPSVHADVQALERVLLNLVTNARDAIGARPGRIEIACGTVGPAGIPPDARAFMPPRDYATLSVSDDGPGVPPEHAARIFEPYFTTKPLGAGSGLGLATAYGLVKQSGGFLLLDRGLSRGARFTVYLPLAGGRPAADADAPPAAGKAVVVAEDDALLRAAMARALGRLGLAVLTAADGLAALDLLSGPQGAEVALLVSDIRMPGLDGVMLTERTRAVRPGLRVLLVSGYADAAERARLADLDIAFLAKPFALSDLTACVSRMLPPSA